MYATVVSASTRAVPVILPRSSMSFADVSVTVRPGDVITQVDDQSLVAGPDARLGETAFDWWLENVPPPPKPAAAASAVAVRA